MKSNSNWEERDDGYHKKPNSTTKGSADYFSKPILPVTDTAGRPIRDGQVDWKAVIDKANGNG